MKTIWFKPNCFHKVAPFGFELDLVFLHTPIVMYGKFVIFIITTLKIIYIMIFNWLIM